MKWLWFYLIATTFLYCIDPPEIIMASLPEVRDW